jgi:hypothetical protein
LGYQRLNPGANAAYICPPFVPRTRAAARILPQDSSDMIRRDRGLAFSRRRAMALAINDTAPDFEAQTTEGKIKFHDWIGGRQPDRP